ncbi:DEAD/DEAH box helicase [Azohydromonas aeria]|uniref:DEAD/DEAH box helicase n=1 Tax=Azohydromonas aeria TaxID=2590212 RepID=UPI0012FC63DB|nr:DEAD/DEAH box helicase [Azohydromonas aeria]
MSFDTLGLHETLTRALADAGYENPTEVQSRAIPPALEGRDLRVSSSTGSGKTASFVLPALERILAARGDNTKRRDKSMTGPRILVLAPTRELAQQVAKAATDYGRHVQGLRVVTVVGGVPYGAQLKALRGPVDILIATPGRLIDHVQSGKALLEHVEMLVLDEADRMLDMGFIDDINFIAGCTPAARQTVMYSATFAGHVGRLADELLRDPLTVDVASHTDTHENIEQRLHWADDLTHKNALLDHLLTGREVEQAVVFTSTQVDADRLADRLGEMGHAVAALHGGMPQGRRNRVLNGLRNRQLRVLVATDVAARGIDVPTISHVINFGLPMKAEDYVHRIGRTGRAGRSGLAVTLAERRDVVMIKRIQQFTTQQIPVATVTGLEPRQPEPRIYPGRPDGGNRGPRFGGKPSFGGPRRDGFDRGPRRDGGFESRGPREGGFEHRAPREGFAPRPDGGHFGGPRPEGRFERRPEGGFGRPHGGGHHAGAPRDRSPFERRADGPQGGGFDRGGERSGPRGPRFGDRQDNRGGFGGERSRGPRRDGGWDR